MSWLLGSSTEPLGHLWSEPEEAAVAVSTSRDAFGSLGLWCQAALRGVQGAASEVRLALGSRERQHRGQKLLTGKAPGPSEAFPGCASQGAAGLWLHTSSVLDLTGPAALLRINPG